MKTLASFKRELKNYKALKLVECSFPNILLNQVREIKLIDTVQFALATKTKDGTIKSSYMYFPKASGYSYDEKAGTFTFSEGKDFFTYKLIK